MEVGVAFFDISAGTGCLFEARDAGLDEIVAALEFEFGEEVGTYGLELPLTVEKLPLPKGFCLVVLSCNCFVGALRSGTGIIIVLSFKCCRDAAYGYTSNCVGRVEKL